MTDVAGWIENYIEGLKKVLDAVDREFLFRAIEALRDAHANDRQVFIFGNGGSAANSSHFSTDLGKGVSDKAPKRFRVLSLNENISWMTALGNDYAYEDVFVRQLENYADPGDVAITLSVSGSSPNLVKAFEWARDNGLRTLAIIGGKRGALADVAEEVCVIPSTHYGHVEDLHTILLHIVNYALMENPDLLKEGS